jgi:phospho-N-acetylmuramoyl-pentapeptide-transferase
MLLYLAEALRDYLSSLNVIRYVSFRVMAEFITSFVVCLVVYPWFIKALQSRAVKQPIREDGPKTHFSKAGTPTMGGALIIVSILLSSLLWADIKNPLVIFTLITGLFFSTIGFFDDLRKLKSKSSKGLSVKVRLFIELAFVVLIFFVFLKFYGPKVRYDTKLFIPFVSVEKFWIDLGTPLYVALGALLIVGIANAVNLTDGLDGLASGPVLTSAGTLLILAYITGAKLGSFDISKYLLIPKVVGAQELSVVASGIMGATLGFLYYNAYPAEIFQGDTGSLGLGGMLASIALLTKNELLSIIFFGIFVFEALSVMLQTGYYKLTKKRIFPMSPIHHSFELLGWPEPKIVVRFWIVSLLLALIALASIKVR